MSGIIGFTNESLCGADIDLMTKYNWSNWIANPDFGTNLDPMLTPFSIIHVESMDFIRQARNESNCFIGHRNTIHGVLPPGVWAEATGRTEPTVKAERTSHMVQG